MAATLSAPAALAQGPIRATPQTIRPIGPRADVLLPIEDARGAFTALASSGRTAIYGIVQNHLGDLVPLAGLIQVRNLLDGSIVAQGRVNDLAQFTFRGIDPGVYVAELVGESGTIISTSGVFSASVGEVLQIAQVIPVAPASGLLSALGTATQASAGSAASAGVLALDTPQPVSPNR